MAVPTAARAAAALPIRLLRFPTAERSALPRRVAHCAVPPPAARASRCSLGRPRPVAPYRGFASASSANEPDDTADAATRFLLDDDDDDDDDDLGVSLFDHDDDIYETNQQEPLPMPEKRWPSTATKAETAENVKAAVLNYVDSAVIEKLRGPDAWHSVPLDNPELKFKVLAACNDNCNRRIPDFVINTVAKAGDLVEFLVNNSIDEQQRKYIPRVHDHFRRLKEANCMPPNLLFMAAPVIDELNEIEKPSIDSYHVPGYTDLPVKGLPSARFLDEQDWRADKPIHDEVDPDEWVKARKLRRTPVPRHWF